MNQTSLFPKPPDKHRKKVGKTVKSDDLPEREKRWRESIEGFDRTIAHLKKNDPSYE